ncbi:helix-turn-helix domain-containing protein [Jeotgalibaca dankookensis]|uniref:helix-turn-helix domain-containing protein n=1 Tax=Jeotgalibaca dankookensis TaxID=708126 RepID=UPI0007810B74|nr:helix-turn-helix domain-containing protein [Jeotgalibaca dankookensis]
MYLTINQTAEYLNLPVHEIQRLIRENQIRIVTVDDEILIYQEQFNLFLKEMEKKKRERDEFLSTPIPEDPDIKDED